MQRRFRKEKSGKAAEVWVETGVLHYSIELYENGAFVERKRGLRLGGKATEGWLSGTDFAALVRIHADGTVRCTWSR